MSELYVRERHREAFEVDKNLSGRKVWQVRRVKVWPKEKERKERKKQLYPFCYSSQQRASTAEEAPSANSSNSLRVQTGPCVWALSRQSSSDLRRSQNRLGSHRQHFEERKKRAMDFFFSSLPQSLPMIWTLLSSHIHFVCSIQTSNVLNSHANKNERWKYTWTFMHWGTKYWMCNKGGGKKTTPPTKKKKNYRFFRKKVGLKSFFFF